MLALAHRLQAAIDRGEFRDRAELACQLGFTRARVTKILVYCSWLPDIQESVLDLEAIDGQEPLSERTLRRIVSCPLWRTSARPAPRPHQLATHPSLLQPTLAGC